MNHLNDSEIASYVDGNLPADRRAALGAHLADCAGCRQEVADVVRLLRDAPTEARRRAPHTVRVGAGAAVLMAATLAGVLFLGRSAERFTDQPVVRSDDISASESRTVIAVVAPSERAPAAVPLTFVWHAADATEYRFTLTTGDGRIVYSAEVADTLFQLPSLPLRAGALYFWNVDALQHGIVASTGMRRLLIDP
jgi:hypothetical protein